MKHSNSQLRQNNLMYRQEEVLLQLWSFAMLTTMTSCEAGFSTKRNIPLVKINTNKGYSDVHS